MELSRFNSNSPGILNEYNAFKYSFENGTMKKQYFKTTCFTPEYLYLDKIRINLNAETINNTITIESKLIVNDIQQIISSLESLQSQSKEMNSQNINYIKILLENYEKENFNVLNDLIKPWHSKIHTGGLISIFGDYRKECVWIKVKDNSDFNTARFIPAPPEQIPELMNNWSILFKSKSEYPLLDALLLFYQFVTIHPLEDDNGKHGWLLFSIFLIRHRIFHSSFLQMYEYFKKDESNFYEKIENIQFDKNFDDFISYCLKRILSQI